jgi:hypothetical protein
MNFYFLALYSSLILWSLVWIKMNICLITTEQYNTFTSSPLQFFCFIEWYVQKENKNKIRIKVHNWLEVFM